jgi:gamma-glutamyltranspeptidase/glutathione hydrolase
VRGAVAAGHPLTAQAGAQVLEAGGNAVDACVAAAYASWVAESPLTSPGAGGFMLIHRARDRSTRLLDFFAAVPGLGRRPRSLREMDEIEVAFSGSSTKQLFRIGAGSCAVPGAALGLETAHRSHGTLPLAELAAPALRLAREGFELTREQGYLHAVLDVILRHTPEARAVYGGEGPLGAGDTLRLPELADTIELLATHGVGELYGGALGRAVVAHVPGITLDDLRAYRVVRRRPVSVRFRGHEVLSNPPPSAGGALIAVGLALLERLGSLEPTALVEVMREQARLRSEPEFLRRLHRGGLAAHVLDETALARGVARVRAGLAGAAERPAAAGTTHISVVDGAGNAASLSASTGSGSGVVVPGTGIHMNNMLGEADLAAGPRGPGVRLTSMMAPTLALGPDGSRPRLVAGSAGSARLRGAIMQIVVNVLGRELGVHEAVERPRLHVDEPHVHLEGGFDEAAADALEARGDDVVRWRRRNLYFGGAAAVELLPDGTLAAAGDPRRGGAGIVVE